VNFSHKQLIVKKNMSTSQCKWFAEETFINRMSYWPDNTVFCLRCCSTWNLKAAVQRLTCTLDLQERNIVILTIYSQQSLVQRQLKFCSNLQLFMYFLVQCFITGNICQGIYLHFTYTFTSMFLIIPQKHRPPLKFGALKR
jgi:hypothetical protein